MALSVVVAITAGCSRTASGGHGPSAPAPTVHVATAPASSDAFEEEANPTTRHAANPLTEHPPPEGVVLPSALRRVVVRPGTDTTAYEWLAEFDVESGALEVTLAMAEGAETPVDAWLMIYAERVRAAGYETTSYGRGFEYQVVSGGRPLSVMVRALGEGSVPEPSTTRIEMSVGPAGG